MLLWTVLCRSWTVAGWPGRRTTSTVRGSTTRATSTESSYRAPAVRSYRGDPCSPSTRTSARSPRSSIPTASTTATSSTPRYSNSPWRFLSLSLSSVPWASTPLEHWGSQVEQHASEVRCHRLQGTTGNTHAKLSPFCGYDTTKCVELRAGTSTPLEHWGVAGRAPKTRVSRNRRRRREWGLGRGCAPSQKIYEFFISKWCDMVHSDENDSDLRCSEVPLKGKNKTLVKILGGRQHRTTPAGQILGARDPMY